MYCNSIYKALGHATSACVDGDKERKAGIAYVYALVKGRTRGVSSSNPLADEGMNVYVGLSNIGRNTLKIGEDQYLGFIERGLEADFTPVEGTVEEIVLQVIDKFGLEGALPRIGSTIKGIAHAKPNFGKDVKEITAGNLQRYEQKAFRDELSQLLR